MMDLHVNDLVNSFYQKLNANADMSDDDSFDTGNGSLPMAVDNSSVGSNNVPVAHTPTLSRKLKDDSLAKALMDSNHPTEGLENYENWTIDLKKLVIGAAFEEGSFGRLFKGKYNGEDVAIKILERPADKPDVAGALERQFQREVTALANLKHPNIVQLIGACRKPMVWCIVTAYAKRGSVRKFLDNRRNRPMPLKLTLKYALDVAKGMAYMHESGFIHRDLKSDNLLIAADRSIKIADFGAARIEAHCEAMTPRTGTYRWMAPEMIQNWPYTKKVDVYSFGIVLWELATGFLPYQEMRAVQASKYVVNTGLRPAIPNDCLPVLSEIMTRCWDTNPEARPPFTEIVRMLENAETEIMTTVRKARFRCLAWFNQ